MSNPSKYMILLTYLLFFTASCQETYQLRFELVTPDGFDLQEDVSRLVISAGDQTEVVTCSREGCPFDAKFTFTEGALARVSVHGYDADSGLVAAGYSPSFVAVDAGMELALFFAPINQGSVIDAQFEAAPLDGGLEPLLTSDDGLLASNVGTLIFGGREQDTVDATPVDDVWFYDPYLLSLVMLEPLTLPLANPAIMDLKDGNFLLFGGRTTGGEISGALLFYSTSSQQAAGSHVISLPAETAPPPTYGAQTVELGPFDGLYDLATGQYLLDAYLMFSGTTEDGSEAPITWVLVYYNLASSTTTIVTRPTEFTLPAGVHATGFNTGDASLRLFLPEVRQWLSATVVTGEQGLEFRLGTEEVAGLPQRTGWRLVWFEERVLAVAGRDEQGRCTGEWFDVDLGGLQVREMSSRVGHCDSAFVRMGAMILELGGVDETDAPHEATGWVMRIGDGGLSVQETMALPMSRPRLEPSVFVLPTGAVAVFGGTDPVGGAPVPSLEMIILDPRKSHEPR